MLRHALRRLLWTLPALVGISLLTFLFLSYAPEPTDDPEVAKVTTDAELAQLKRARYLDLPRFVNSAPRDVRTRANEAVSEIVRGDANADQAKKELERLGGAALPYVLPSLDALAPAERTKVALALAPLAVRMGLASADDAADPGKAAAFWTRFWDDRGIEFRKPAVRSAVARLVRYGSSSTSRETDLLALDTFALDATLEALVDPVTEADVDHDRALVDVAAHATQKDDRIPPGASIETAAAVVERWRRFWSIYGSDFSVFSGAARGAAMVTETRYGKWVLETITHRFGRARGGGTVMDEIAARAPLTLVILFGGIGLAYAVAIPLGALSAAYRRRRVDLAIGAAVIALYAVPSAVLSILLARIFGVEGSLVGPIVVLALTLLAAPTRQQRSALATAMTQDYVTAARARGAGRVRAILVHALRSSLLPVVTLMTLEAPMALSRVFVVEQVFGVRGLGEATIRAVQEKDVAWLMAISIFSALLASVFVILTDVGYALIDPRLESGVRRGRA